MGKLKKIVKSDAFKIVVLVIICDLLIASLCGVKLYSYQQKITSISQADKKLQEYTKQMKEDVRKMSEERKTAKKLIDSGEAEIYMEGEPVSDKFEIEGIDINRYRVKVKGKKVYISR